MDAKTYCEEAAKLVSNARAKQHGDMLVCHLNIAELWNAYLCIRPDRDKPLAADEIAIMMVLLKIGRTLTGDHNRDDYVDMCGYSAIAGHLADETQ